jgi:hypothetical protein
MIGQAPECKAAWHMRRVLRTPVHARRALHFDFLGFAVDWAEGFDARRSAGGSRATILH